MNRQFYEYADKHCMYFLSFAIVAAVLLVVPLQPALAQDCNEENCPAGCCGDTCCEESETCCDGSCCATTCCGTTCLSTGQACCNGQPYSTATQGCCNGQIYTLATHCCVEGQVEAKCGANCCTSSESCCGDTTCYDPATQGCCNGVVYTLATHACCEGVVYNKTTHACCNSIVYNKTTHACCDGVVYNKTTHACCDTVVYNKSTHCCADSVVHSKIDTDDDGTGDCCSLPLDDLSSVESCSGTTGTLTQNPDYVPAEEAGGCTAPPPWGNDPCGLGDTSFFDACHAHDIAWCTCGGDRAAADDAFLNGDDENDGMLDICNDAASKDCDGDGDEDGEGLFDGDCDWWAEFYHGVVTGELGDDVYEDTQLDACLCCVDED